MTATLQAVPVQDKYATRARYFDNENGFSFAWPAVPAHQFLAERDRAFDRRTPTGPIALDLSAVLKTAGPATTPTLLCRYLVIRAGDTLRCEFAASGEIVYVMTGAGHSAHGADAFAWSAGDLFCFPGGQATVHRAGDGDCLLFCVTNEPLLAFERLRPPAADQAAFQATLWPAAEIDRRLEPVYARPITAQTTGASVQLATVDRHNGVAVTLAIQAEGVHSLIGGQRCDWSEGAAQITPATLLHSHHNRGPRRMRSFVMQDEGLHMYTRTPGFSFD
jgi:hypothetical protein